MRIPQDRVVYLDQNHVSQIAKGRLGRPVAVAEMDLFNFLRTNVENAELVCPFSFWHVAETAGYATDVEAMTSTAEVLDILSRGTCLRYWGDVGHDELDELELRPRERRSIVDPLSSRGSCFPRDWSLLASRASGLSIAGGVGFVQLAVSILSAGDGRTVLETFKATTAGDFRRFLEQQKSETPLSRQRAWSLALGHYATSLLGQRGLEGTSFERLVDDNLRTLAVVTRFATEALLNPLRRVRLPDSVDVCHLAHLGHVGWFLTDGNVCGRSRTWASAVGARVFASAEPMLEALRAELSSGETSAARTAAQQIVAPDEASPRR